ncbi:MAG: Beta-mannosidase [Polyangiaceae bacterium]|nr:Beta-mannosidase [Polyangiaceae bacterium]
MIQELEHWLVQSSSVVGRDGARLSQGEVDSERWYAARLPATVLSVLVAHGVYPDPYVGMNFLELPGRGPAHQNFSNHAMPEDSPFRVPWWFRTELEPADADARPHTWLELDGLNYRANLYVNGALVRSDQQLVGAYRAFEVLLDQHLAPGRNPVALEVFPPNPDDLAITWVDWNPSPPDKNLGLWRGARVRRTGAVRLSHPQLLSRLPDANLAVAELRVFVTLENATHEAVTATLRVSFEGHDAELEVELAPRERREVGLDSETVSALRLARPRLWWPRGRGEQPLYGLKLSAWVRGELSDRCELQGGIREVTSELTDREHALFRVNKKPILIRGGGWARDMLLRSNAERELYEYEYVKDLGLNTIRFEGMVESTQFLERCDRDGMLVIAGFCCCDHWEKWDHWKPEDVGVAEDSLRCELRRLRNHPSLIAWWYGSDFPPPRHVEERYLAVLAEERWPNAAHSSAAAKPTELTGPSGMKMAGPYDYVPPSYWLKDTERGGAFGFATEVGPGPAIPKVETLREMFGDARVWPPNESWNLHSGGGPFKDRDLYDTALAARYGAARDLEDYVHKAQLACYEAERAMFEAYGRRKYVATGVIQWMLNNAWPSLIWHLWDHSLRAAGGYYGTKKACEPLHIQYDDGEGTISVVSELTQRTPALRALVRIVDLELQERFRFEAELTVEADNVAQVCALPPREELGPTHFLQLELREADGRVRSRNFYWLSSEPDVVDHPSANWYMAPLVGFASFHALADLPEPTLALERSPGGVSLRNVGRTLAFFMELRALDRAGLELVPTYFSDNYVSLLPGESLDVAVRSAVGVAAPDVIAVRSRGTELARLQF